MFVLKYFPNMFLNAFFVLQFVNCLILLILRRFTHFGNACIVLLSVPLALWKDTISAAQTLSAMHQYYAWASCSGATTERLAAALQLSNPALTWLIVHELTNPETNEFLLHNMQYKIYYLDFKYFRNFIGVYKITKTIILKMINFICSGLFCRIL